MKSIIGRLIPFKSDLIIGIFLDFKQNLTLLTTTYFFLTLQLWHQRYHSKMVLKLSLRTDYSLLLMMAYSQRINQPKVVFHRAQYWVHFYLSYIYIYIYMYIYIYIYIYMNALYTVLRIQYLLFYMPMIHANPMNGKHLDDLITRIRN